jgi:hypothetical protein
MNLSAVGSPAVYVVNVKKESTIHHRICNFGTKRNRYT